MRDREVRARERSARLFWLRALLFWLGLETSWLLRLLAGIVTYGAALALIRGIPQDARPKGPPSHPGG